MALRLLSSEIRNPIPAMAAADTAARRIVVSAPWSALSGGLTVALATIADRAVDVRGKGQHLFQTSGACV